MQKDSSLQFVYWLKKAKQFNEKQKGKQMQQTPDGFLDPKSLTPEELYKLQSDTWTQGYEVAEANIIKLLEELAYTDQDGHEMIGEFKTDLIALIKGEK